MAGWSSLLYRCANRAHDQRLVSLDYNTPSDMRGPGGAEGLYAIECAMDELAYAANIDPLELRLINYSDKDQFQDKPYSSKELRECYRQGAEKFGWSKRKPQPRSMRDGNELVGWGMATGIWPALQVPASARAVLTANGSVEIASATADIGPGTYTMMAQLGAELLGVPLDNVTVKLGDSALPDAPVEGGSFTRVIGRGPPFMRPVGRCSRTSRLRTRSADRRSPAPKLEDVALADGRSVARTTQAREARALDLLTRRFRRYCPRFQGAVRALASDTRVSQTSP